MEQYRLSVQSGLTIIEQVPFKMSVQHNAIPPATSDTALLEATLYREEGTFVKNGSYLFEALNNENKPISTVDIDQFRSAIDFFFTSILNTDLYVKSIPKGSSLCKPELKAFQYDRQ